MFPKSNGLTLILVVASAVPMSVLAADWFLVREARLGPVSLPSGAQEVRKLYQLREFCNESDIVQRRLELDTRKPWETAAAGKNRMTDGGLLSRKPGAATGPYTVSFASASLSPGDQERGQIQNLRDRNSRYFEKMVTDVSQHGAENIVIWGRVEARHEELVQAITTGKVEACVAALDAILPTRVKLGGRE